MNTPQRTQPAQAAAAGAAFFSISAWSLTDILCGTLEVISKHGSGAERAGRAAGLTQP